MSNKKWKMRQIFVAFSEYLNFKVKIWGTVIWFWGWDQIENTFWDYTNFKKLGCFPRIIATTPYFQQISIFKLSIQYGCFASCISWPFIFVVLIFTADLLFGARWYNGSKIFLKAIFYLLFVLPTISQDDTYYTLRKWCLENHCNLNTQLLN